MKEEWTQNILNQMRKFYSGESLSNSTSVIALNTIR